MRSEKKIRTGQPKTPINSGRAERTRSRHHDGQIEKVTFPAMKAATLTMLPLLMETADNLTAPRAQINAGHHRFLPY